MTATGKFGDWQAFGPNVTPFTLSADTAATATSTTSTISTTTRAQRANRIARATQGAIRITIRRVITNAVRGIVTLTHNGFALMGLALAFALLTLATQPELRQAGENRLIGWLQARQAQLAGGDSTYLPETGDERALERSTATNPRDLPKHQADLAYWLSKKYRVAPEPVSALVAEAFELGKRTKLEPTLILAVVAVESGFNPFAQSHVGAQGLMQVMTRVHSEKYESFGGQLAAFDPVANLRVGVKVLQECINRAGSVEAGLRYYVGAANQENDGGYSAKVMAEQSRLKAVSGARLTAL